MPQFFAQMNPVFQPAMRLIASITQANPAVVTTTFAHLYITGTIIRLDIPSYLGMPQLDGFVGPITVTGSTTFSIPVDSTNFQAFVVPGSISTQASTYAMVIPIGEVSSILTAAVQNTLPHSS